MGKVRLTSLQRPDEGEQKGSVVDEISEEAKAPIRRIAVFVDVADVMVLIMTIERPILSPSISHVQ